MSLEVGSGELTAPSGVRAAFDNFALDADLDPAGTVTSVTGTVQVVVEGTPTTVAVGATLAKDTEVQTGLDGQVAAACDDDSASYSLPPNSSVLLNAALCTTGATGSVDVTAGAFQFGVGPRQAGRAGARHAVDPSAVSVRTPVSQAVASEAGANFVTKYTQEGSMGTVLTTVVSGSVEVADANTGGKIVVTPGNPGVVRGPVPVVVAAVLPSSRSVRVGVAATAFATIVNAGPIRALRCKLEPATSVPATFLFQTTDPATNQPVGKPGTPVEISGNLGAQSFVFAFTPTDRIDPTEVHLRLGCGGTAAPSNGVNTLQLSAERDPVPDIIALASSTSTTIPGVGGTGAFAVASVNNGAGATITASAEAGPAVGLPVSVRLCRTDPRTAQCLAPPAERVTTEVNAGETPTFSIFVTGRGQVPFDPAEHRVFVRFRDAGGVLRGSTSVAVQTQ